MSIFKIEEMTEGKALRMEKDLTERLESLKNTQKHFEMFNGFSDNNGFAFQIKETQNQLEILNTQYADYLI